MHLVKRRGKFWENRLLKKILKNSGRVPMIYPCSAIARSQVNGKRLKVFQRQGCRFNHKRRKDLSYDNQYERCRFGSIPQSCGFH